MNLFTWKVWKRQMRRDERGCIGLGRGVVGKWEMTDNEYWVSFGVSESHSVVSNSLGSMASTQLKARSTSSAESEKWKSLSCVQLFVTPWTIQSMEFSRPEYWSGLPCPPPGDLPNSGIKLRSPTLQADSLPAEPQGKPKNTGVGSLSLFQGTFPTQESNRGLLHCRRILYQLSYQGSPAPPQLK